MIQSNFVFGFVHLARFSCELFNKKQFLSINRTEVSVRLSQSTTLKQWMEKHC